MSIENNTQFVENPSKLIANSNGDIVVINDHSNGNGNGHGIGGGNGNGGGKGNGNGGGKGSGGGKKGELFGDMYLLYRDANGVPILSPDGFYQPIDINGELIPLDEEGHPLDEEATVEVELGRMNVIRSPERVLDRGLGEVLSVLAQADAINTDAAGRLEITIGEEIKTIDAPIENLAVYRELLNNGHLEVSLKGTVQIEDGLDAMFDQNSTPDAVDLLIAKSFLAGATDKTVPMTIDKIIYTHAIMGLEGTIIQKEIEYIDFLAMDFTYNRSELYSDKYVEVLVEISPGVYEIQTVNIFATVFNSEQYDESGGAAVYTQAAEDARRVINFVHDYAY
ncbi:MAG: hypothetical protein ACQETE_10105 [Bacteroidota bacterium]